MSKVNMNFNQFYIDGQWLENTTGDSLDVINPATEEVIAQVACGDIEQVSLAVAAAKASFSAWSNTPSKTRSDIITKIASEMERRQDELVTAVSQTMGCPEHIASWLQVEGAIYAMGLFAEHTAVTERQEQGDKCILVKEPIGVCGFINPWNFPLHQFVGKVGAALAAGCTMVVKPSEQTPWQDFIMTEIISSVLADFNAPAGVFNLVPGTGVVVGDALSRHKDIDMVSFTGSTGAGIKVAQAAAPTVKRVMQELGGKSPFIITEDADLASAVKYGVEDVMLNSGQTCTTFSRMLVPQALYVQAIELAKGPQGTLYGKNTTGGAINFITVKPTEDFEAFIEADYSSFQTLEITSAVGGALTDTVNGRLSLNYAKSNEGWQTDDVTGEEFGFVDTFAVRGQLGFDLGDSGTGLLRVYANKDKSKPLSPDGKGIEDVLGDDSFSVLNSSSDPTMVSVGDLDVGRDESGSGLALTLDYSFESFDVVSISSMDTYERQVTDNYDGSAAATMELVQDDKLDQWSQEIRFISTGNDDFTWVFGANISNEKVDAYDYFDDSFLVTDSAFDGTLYPDDISAIGLDRFIADYVQETDSYGFYLHTETQLNDSWKLIAGIRYSYDERAFDGVSTNESFGEIFPVTELNETNDEDAITGKLGLDWKVNDDLLVFGNVSTSYKSGVYYGGAVLDGDAWSYVEPEDVKSAELGFKWTLLDGSMQLNGAAFALQYENRQSLLTFTSGEFSDFSGFAVADTTLATVPESETSGFELDVNWLPMEGLTLQAGLSSLNSKVTKAPTTEGLRGINVDPSVNMQANDDGFGFVDALAAPLVNGTVLSQAPEWSYNALVAYEIPVASEMYLRFQTSYSYSGTQ